MGMGSGGNDGGAMADINVTPLVDVMLVLLIIFMITAPLLAQGVEIDLPKETAQPLTVPDEDQLVLRLDKSLTLFLNDNQFTMSELEPSLVAVAEANPGKPVFLEADGDVAYRNVAKVLAAAKRAGIPRVGMVFDPGTSENESEE